MKCKCSSEDLCQASRMGQLPLSATKTSPSPCGAFSKRKASTQEGVEGHMISRGQLPSFESEGPMSVGWAGGDVRCTCVLCKCA